MMSSGVSATQVIPERIQVRITGTPTVYSVIDHEGIKKQLIGISRKDAKDFLDKIIEIDSYTIRMRPFWRRVLPNNSDEIEISQ
jgi:hypothetical protein